MVVAGFALLDVIVEFALVEVAFRVCMVDQQSIIIFEDALQIFQLTAPDMMAVPPHLGN